MEGVSHITGHALKHPGSPLPVFDLGVAPYLPVQALQARLRAAVAAGAAPGVLMLLEHEPVITMGSRAGEQDLRGGEAGAAGERGAHRAADQTGKATACGAPPPKAAAPLSSALTALTGGIPVVESERGGQATLHAPGQLVSYPVVRIPGHDLSAFVRGLEEANILLLAGFGIHAERRAGRPGLYVDGDKISSVGLRCQRWVSSHGTSLNVDLDLSLFDAIVSCGEPQLRQTSMERLLAAPPSIPVVKQAYLRAVNHVFGWELLPLRPVTHDRVEAELGLEGQDAPSR